ncbi:zinc dependent phospholipase C family protein [Chitinophagales bacterium]|nr:zinc dependent phospholipase C family protein [Chitinophagales bacterium]
MLRNLILILFSFCFVHIAQAWGFWAHQRINRLAIFSLPPAMFTFYKANIEYITEHAVDPDKRRYVMEGEAPKHFIDLDHFCIHPCDSFPRKWPEAKRIYSEDTLNAYGIVPWAIEWTMNKLTGAFVDKDKALILKYSADLGHYIADSHVPLHTTENYNGQLTDQHGIHGFWESRLPELFHEEYSFWVGGANYIKNRNEFIWTNILHAHNQLEGVLSLEMQLDKMYPKDQKYAFEVRGESLIKTYSRGYALAYHELLEGMVEEQMQLSVKHVADLWFTCWVSAGLPNLSKLDSNNIRESEGQKNEAKVLKIKSRAHAETGLDVLLIQP